jgi:hypothetical protein
MHLLVFDGVDKTSDYIRIERQEDQQNIKIGMEEPEISRGLTAGFTSTIFGRH